MDNKEYTLLPFLNPLTSAKLLAITGAVIIAILIIKAVLYRRSLTLHRAPTSTAFAYITASFINILLCTFLYWYWALPLCAVISLIYAFTTAGEIKDANSEERTGVYGLNKEIRRIRGEIFNDMSVEEQLEYRANVKEYRFSKVLFVIVTMLVAVLFLLGCYLFCSEYLPFPILIEK